MNSNNFNVSNLNRGCGRRNGFNRKFNNFGRNNNLGGGRGLNRNREG
jgi:hypothetical protein